MKTPCKVYHFLCLSALLLFISCVGEHSFEIPHVNAIPPEINPNAVISIETLHSLWLQNTEGDGIYELDATLQGKYLVGYVISSDESGNFFEEVYLQDEPENPLIGIKLLIDSSPLYARFNLGRRVYVLLNGLSVGKNSGVFSLGMTANNAIGPISEGLMNTLAVRDTLVAEIVPKVVPIGSLSPLETNQYLRLQGVQFHKSQLLEGVALTYAGELDDMYDGERLLESCEEGNRMVFSTSSFANFKGEVLEGGSGYIDGIALFDYYGERLVFSVNDSEDIHLDDDERCDGVVLQCEGNPSGTTVIWSEDFENYEEIEELLQEGWVLYTPWEGTTQWKLDAFSGNSYARISGYNSGDVAIESWLISPPIDLTPYQEKSLFLEVQPSYDNGARLQVYIATNFDGNPLTAEWQEVDLVLPPGPYAGFGDNYALGPISLSCIDDSVVLAWVYKGTDPYKTTRFHIDNVRILGD